MQTRALTHYSPSLGKDMHMMIYGHGGVPFLAFPAIVMNANPFTRGHRYLVEQVVPLMREENDALPFTLGMSMGADHAAITFLRRPELFRGMLALSGVYDADYFFGGFMNPTLYDNSPERFLPNMPADHPYVALYNQKKLIFCVGQGAWEEDGVRTLRHLQRVFESKGIHAWCDFWGYDVNHDWPWWFRQLRYFLPFLLND